MKREQISIWATMIASALLGLILSATCAAQTTNQNLQQPPPTQTANQQANQAADYLRQLNLTPDQIQKIRDINRDLRDERQAANLKLREAQRALNEAVESPSPNESLIEQRSREMAEANANVIRLRSLTQARILQVLTPEQRIRLKEMQEQAQLIRRQQVQAIRQANRQQQGNGVGQKQGGQKRINNPVGLQPKQRKPPGKQMKR